MSEYNKELLKKVYIKNNMIYIVCGFDFLNKQYILRSIGLFKVYTCINNKEIEFLKDKKDLIEYYSLENEKNKKFLDKYNEIIINMKNKNEEICFLNLPNRMREIIKNEKALNFLKNYGDEYKKELHNLEKGKKRLNKRFYKYFGKENYTFMMDYLKNIDFVDYGYSNYKYKEYNRIIEELKNLDYNKI